MINYYHYFTLSLHYHHHYYIWLLFNQPIFPHITPVTAIHPVLEYACPVWHSSLTVAQTKALESLQQRAMKIIFSDKDYLLSLIVASVDTLESRREQLTERFFRRSVLRESSPLLAAGQTGLGHHRQTTSCENIYIIPH